MTLPRPLLLTGLVSAAFIIALVVALALESKASKPVEKPQPVPPEAPVSAVEKKQDSQTLRATSVKIIVVPPLQSLPVTPSPAPAPALTPPPAPAPAPDPPPTPKLSMRAASYSSPPPRSEPHNVCSRYGGHKVETRHHRWLSWHCVYPHRRHER